MVSPELMRCNCEKKTERETKEAKHLQQLQISRSQLKVNFSFSPFLARSVGLDRINSGTRCEEEEKEAFFSKLRFANEKHL